MSFIQNLLRKQPPPAPNWEGRPIRNGQPRPFTLTASTYLNNVGYGFCFVSAASGVKLRVEHQSVTTNINRSLIVPQPIVKIYAGVGPGGQVVDSTYSGDFAQSDSVLNVLPGDSLCCEWYCETNAQSSHVGLLATYVVRGFQTQVMA